MRYIDGKLEKYIFSQLHFKLATYPAIVIFCGYFISVYN